MRTLVMRPLVAAALVFNLAILVTACGDKGGSDPAPAPQQQDPMIKSQSPVRRPDGTVQGYNLEASHPEATFECKLLVNYEVQPDSHLGFRGFGPASQPDLVQWGPCDPPSFASNLKAGEKAEMKIRARLFNQHSETTTVVVEGPRQVEVVAENKTPETPAPSRDQLKVEISRDPATFQYFGHDKYAVQWDTPFLFSGLDVQYECQVGTGEPFPCASGRSIQLDNRSSKLFVRAIVHTSDQVVAGEQSVLSLEGLRSEFAPEPLWLGTLFQVGAPYGWHMTEYANSTVSDTDSANVTTKRITPASDPGYVYTQDELAKLSILINNPLMALENRYDMLGNKFQYVPMAYPNVAAFKEDFFSKGWASNHFRATTTNGATYPDGTVIPHQTATYDLLETLEPMHYETKFREICRMGTQGWPVQGGRAGQPLHPNDPRSRPVAPGQMQLPWLVAPNTTIEVYKDRNGRPVLGQWAVCRAPVKGGSRDYMIGTIIVDASTMQFDAIATRPAYNTVTRTETHTQGCQSGPCSKSTQSQHTVTEAHAHIPEQEYIVPGPQRGYKLVYTYIAEPTVDNQDTANFRDDMLAVMAETFGYRTQQDQYGVRR